MHILCICFVKCRRRRCILSVSATDRLAGRLQEGVATREYQAQKTNTLRLFFSAIVTINDPFNYSMLYFNEPTIQTYFFHLSPTPSLLWSDKILDASSFPTLFLRILRME